MQSFVRSVDAEVTFNNAFTLAKFLNITKIQFWLCIRLSVTN